MVAEIFDFFMFPGCQPKTFKTFILMVKPLKPLFFSEKPLKPLFFSEKPLFSGKAVFFQYSGCQDPIKSYIFSNVLYFKHLSYFSGNLGATQGKY